MSSSEPPPGDLMEVLLDRLGPQVEGPQNRLEALRVLRARRAARRRRRQPQLDPDLAALFGLIAVEPSDLGELSPELAGIVEQGLAQGLEREALPAVFQAYVRGVGRVVAAEAAMARELMARTPAPEQARVLADALDTLVPVGARGFDLLRRMLLLDALVDALGTIDGEPSDREVMTVAMVDLVGSTKYLTTTEPADLEHLVDALFAASQSATAHRAAHVFKYVGDGVFLSGRDTAEVADAALEVIARLEAALPLRARGGMATGPVVQRAGDVFGLPINAAHITTKSARPGTLVATADAAAVLPPARRSRYRTVRLANPALGAVRVATIRPAADG